MNSFSSPLPIWKVTVAVLFSTVGVGACGNGETGEKADLQLGDTLSAAAGAPVSDNPTLPAAPDTLAGSAPLWPASERVDAPDFTLKTLAGDQFSMRGQRGRVVVLNFWATWCPPCRKEIPDFIALQTEYESKGLVIAGISLDEEGESVVRPFADEIDINYPVMVDQKGVSDLYGPIMGLPSTFVIDRKGIVRYFAPGMLSREALEPVLEKLLNEEA